MVVVEGLHLDIYGNGKEGLKARAEHFMSEYAGMRAEQQQQHAANSRKLNFIAVMVAIGTFIIGALGLLLTIETLHRSDLDPAKIFHSQNSQPEMSERAKLPDMR